MSEEETQTTQIRGADGWPWIASIISQQLRAYEPLRIVQGLPPLRWQFYGTDNGITADGFYLLGDEPAFHFIVVGRGDQTLVHTVAPPEEQGFWRNMHIV